MDKAAALHELAAREIQRLQGELEAKEPVTLSDLAVMELRESSHTLVEKLLESAGSTADKITASLDASVKQASKANTDHLKASTKILDRAVRGISKRHSADMRTILDQVAEVSKSNPVLIQALITVLQDMKPRPLKPIQFDIRRDTNGYMKSVVARPAVTESEPETLRGEYS